MHVTGKVLNDSNERIDMESTVKNITKAMIGIINMKV